MEQVRLIRRGREERVTQEAFGALLDGRERVLLDVGTGDGMYPYRQARSSPELLAIGVDPVAEGLRSTSGKIGRKPARGGVNNLILVVASVTSLPPGLSGRAHRVTVNFPWGSLLRGVSLPDPEVLSGLRRAMRAGGRLDLLLNAHTFGEDHLRESLDLPELTIERVYQVLMEGYRACGLQILEGLRVGPGPLPERTTWGQRLTVGSRRETLAVRAVAI